jgi:hypothetical protein
MSSKNLVSASQAARTLAPFADPSREEITSVGAPGGRRRRRMAFSDPPVKVFRDIRFLY